MRDRQWALSVRTIRWELEWASWLEFLLIVPTGCSYIDNTPHVRCEHPHAHCCFQAPWLKTYLMWLQKWWCDYPISNSILRCSQSGSLRHFIEDDPGFDGVLCFQFQICNFPDLWKLQMLVFNRNDLSTFPSFVQFFIHVISTPHPSNQVFSIEVWSRRGLCGLQTQFMVTN